VDSGLLQKKEDGSDDKKSSHDFFGIFIDCRPGRNCGCGGKNRPDESARLLYLRSGTQDRGYPEKN
jgi:hypothetical protein